MAIQPREDNATRWKRLGDMLLEAGLITRGQLDEGLAEKDRQKCFLGQSLVKLGYISQNELISFLVKQCKIPHINLVDYQIDPRIVTLLPNDLCLQYELIPIDNLGTILTVAMVNPLDIDALEHARAACPALRIKPILCTPEHFQTVAKRLLVSGESAAKTQESDALSLSSFGLRPPAMSPPPPDNASATTSPASAAEPLTAESATGDDYSTLVREILGELLNIFQGPAGESAELSAGPLSSAFREDLQFSFTLTSQGTPCYVSEAVKRVTGHEAADFRERFLDLLTGHPGNPVLRRAITLSCAGQQQSPVEAEFTGAAGRPIMLHVALIPVFDDNQQLVAVQGVARDVTRRERTEEQIFEAANHDHLTGLLNRRSFMARLADILQLAKRHRIPMSIGVINLDGFTQLNREFGHDEGNRVLVKVAQLLRSSLRGEDSLARSGGDEFYVLMPHVPPAEAQNGLARCRQAVSEAAFTSAEGRAMTVTLTAALVCLGEQNGDASDLVESARERVTAGKVAGGDRVVT